MDPSPLTLMQGSMTLFSESHSFWFVFSPLNLQPKNGSSVNCVMCCFSKGLINVNQKTDVALQDPCFSWTGIWEKANVFLSEI